MTPDTCIAVTLPADKIQQKYAATVVATCHGLESAEAVSNKVLWGEAYKLPVHIYPNQEQADLCTVFDGNHDNKGWYYSAPKNDFRIGYTSEGAGDVDDWMFLPYIRFDSSDIMYLFTFDAGLFTSQYLEESIEIFAGKVNTPEAMTIPVVEEFCLLDEDKNYEALFSVPEPGIYYIGIHCTSKENQYGLWVKNIQIVDNGIVADSPAKVTDLTAEGASMGELRATVSFTMPVADVSGNAIPSDAMLRAEVCAASVHSIDAKPGEKVTLDVDTKQGDNQITVTVFYNDHNSIAASANVYTGVTVPVAVSNVRSTVSPDMRSVTMTWDAPEYGEDEGYIVPSELVYHIFKYVPNSSGTSDLVEIDTTSQCEYTYTNDETQEYLDLGVAAGNAAGICPMVMGISEVIGRPYSLPVIEKFEDPNGNFAQNPWLVYQPTYDYSANWTIGSLHDVNSAFDDRKSLAIIANVRYDAGLGCLGAPRFTTEGESDVKVTISVYNGPEAGDMSLTGECYGIDDKLIIGEISPSSDTPVFTEHTFTLPDQLLDQPWVQLYVECDLPDPMHLAAFNSIEIIGTSVGVSSIGDGSLSISTGKGFLKISGCGGRDINISGINGINVFSGKSVADELLLQLESGIYLVRVDGHTVKAAVR